MTIRSCTRCHIQQTSNDECDQCVIENNYQEGNEDTKELLKCNDSVLCLASLTPITTDDLGIPVVITEFNRNLFWSQGEFYKYVIPIKIVRVDKPLCYECLNHACDCTCEKESTLYKGEYL